MSRVVTQLLGATSGVSSPGTDSVKESLAGKNADSLIGAQTDANQAKTKVMKEVLQSPVETLSSVEAANFAAVGESSMQIALEPQERSDISRVSTIVDTYVLPPVLQHQLQASSDVRNGGPAKELCVTKPIEPVVVV